MDVDMGTVIVLRRPLLGMLMVVHVIGEIPGMNFAGVAMFIVRLHIEPRHGRAK